MEEWKADEASVRRAGGCKGETYRIRNICGWEGEERGQNWGWEAGGSTAGESWWLWSAMFECEKVHPCAGGRGAKIEHGFKFRIVDGGSKEFCHGGITTVGSEGQDLTGRHSDAIGC